MVEVVESKRTGGGNPWFCPRFALFAVAPSPNPGRGGVPLPELACPAQLEKSLFIFASRDAMDIQGLGEAVVQGLLAKNLVRDPRRPLHVDAGTNC